MAYNIKKLLEIAEAEVGYKEKKSNAQLDDKEANAGSNNYTKYWRDMGSSLQGQAWCNCFVNWCFKEAYGESAAKELLCCTVWSYYTPTSSSYFKNKGQWHTEDAQIGDVIYFKNATRICHVGIVYNTDDTKIYTIEGNSGDGVNKRSYLKTDSTIAGFGRPIYGTSAQTNYTDEQKNFIESIANALKKYAVAYNIVCYSAVIAQAINESGWGKSSLAVNYFNFFGMKCGSKWTGKSVNLTTKEEYETGTLTTIKDNFRVYNDLEDGVKGYLDFINTERYANLKGVTDYKEYITNIKNDGYATGSTYIANLCKLVETYNLTDYDPAPANLKSNEEIAAEVLKGKWGNGQERKDRLAAAGHNYSEIQKIVNELLKPNYTNYTVKEGDTLASIAAKYNTTAEKIVDDNNLVYKGQILKIY